MTLGDIGRILAQARNLGTVRWIYFEGGEPFLFYATLLAGARRAHEAGFDVGIVTNAYWATSVADAVECLRPFASLVGDLSVSADLYHADTVRSEVARNALAAAAELGMPTGAITVARPEAADAVVGQLPQGECGVMYRGRAAEKLAPAAPHQPWSTFTVCRHENLRDPGRVHVDPLGNVEVCQGIAIGNLFQVPLTELVARFAPDADPVTGPLLRGGPAALAEEHGVAREPAYADACHLCYETRRTLRDRFPAVLGPEQMYGLVAG
jgi:hypothetical protein